MNYDIENLELNKIIKAIASKAVTTNGQKAVFAIKPSNDIMDITEKLQETEEMRLIVVSHSAIPFPIGADILPFLKRAQLGSSLLIFEIIDIKNFLKGVNNILKFFQFIKLEKIAFPHLEKYLLLDALEKLTDEIEEKIDDNGIVSDYASPLLKELRQNIRREENNLRNKLNELLIKNSKILAENLIVIRNNVFCLPVKAESKNNIKGVIHDESSSGQTVYLEPDFTREINIKIQNLKEKEKREIDRIIYELSAKIATYEAIIAGNVINVTFLDLISAKALYAKKNDCFMPQVTKEKYIYLKKARHPLLDPKTAVCLDLLLGRKYQGIIVTGPNTGGKTVSLKTVGLLNLMTQSGILIPADPSSVIPVFDNIFSDIGDEQSIEQSLSTFSSHLKKIIKIVNQADNNSLILLDELGSGTDPKEGSNLARAIIDHFINLGALLILTTHYPDLKEYAFLAEKVINASMEFDAKTFTPLYRLNLGMPGRSNALEIAKMLGLKQEIIKKAEENLKVNDSEAENLIAKLEFHGQLIQEEKKEAEKNRLKLEELKQEYEEKINNLNKTEQNILKKAELEGKKYLENLKNDSLKIINELDALKSKADFKGHELADLKFRLTEIGHEGLKTSGERLPINVNDTVLVLEYQKEAVVTKIHKGKYFVKMGNLEFSYLEEELRFLRKTVNKKPAEKKGIVNLNVSREMKLSLDLRGFRFEEVKNEIEKFIDKALINNMTQISIIHGFGTGAVKKAVWDYLKGSPYIKSFRYGAEGEGLMGATIAYLK